MTKKELLDEYFKQKPETGISQRQFANKHKISKMRFFRWLQKDERYKSINKKRTKEFIKNKVDEFFKLNQEAGISRYEFARKHKINPRTFNDWLLKDDRYNRTRAEFTKEPTLDTSVKQVLDEQKEKNAETVYDSGTLINEYIDSPIHSDDLDQYLQPSISDETNLSYDLDELEGLLDLNEIDKPSTSKQFTVQTRLKNKIKSATTTANKSNRMQTYPKLNQDRAFKMD